MKRIRRGMSRVTKHINQKNGSSDDEKTMLIDLDEMDDGGTIMSPERPTDMPISPGKKMPNGFVAWDTLLHEFKVLSMSLESLLLAEAYLSYGTSAHRLHTMLLTALLAKKTETSTHVHKLFQENLPDLQREVLRLYALENVMYWSKTNENLDPLVDTLAMEPDAGSLVIYSELIECLATLHENLYALSLGKNSKKLMSLYETWQGILDELVKIPPEGVKANYRTLKQSLDQLKLEIQKIVTQAKEHEQAKRTLQSKKFNVKMLDLKALKKEPQPLMSPKDLSDRNTESSARKTSERENKKAFPIRTASSSNLFVTPREHPSDEYQEVTTHSPPRTRRKNT